MNISVVYMMSRQRLRYVLGLLGFVGLVSSPVAAEPGDVTQYEAVASFSAEEIDTEVSALFDGYEKPKAAYGVEVYIVQYESTYPDGSTAPITAQLFLPRMPARQERPLYLFAPGSTGVMDACRVSQEHILGIHWGLYRAHTLAYVAQGMIGLLPDYMGMGDPDRLQPFFQADAGAHMVLDGIRAVERFLWTREEPQFSQVFLAGFSQGGHATFAAADLRAEYAPEVGITGTIGYGPTTDLYALLREFVVVAPVVAFSFKERYGMDRFNPHVMFQDRWASSLDHDVTRQCIGGIQRYYPWDLGNLYRESFADALLNGNLARDYPEIDAVLARHTVGLSGHGIPALIVQGTEDIVVYPESQTRFVKALRRAGSDVRYYIYPGERHDVRQAAFFDVLAWMEELTR